MSLDVELQHKINRGELDINNTELFMSALFKALTYKLNNQLKLRDKNIPHFVLNTGDDIMYLEVKGQDYSIEPKEISNEDFVYNSVPRCIMNLNDIEVIEDQLTSPYTMGNFDVEYDDLVHGFHAEFRRMPIKMNVNLKYYLDNFIDTLALTQQIITKLLFIQSFTFTYLGQTICASYKVPSSYSHEKNITFVGGTTDQKLRTIELTLEVESNLPVYNERTAVENDKFFKQQVHQITTTTIHKETKKQ